MKVGWEAENVTLRCSCTAVVFSLYLVFLHKNKEAHSDIRGDISAVQLSDLFLKSRWSTAALGRLFKPVCSTLKWQWGRGSHSAPFTLSSRQQSAVWPLKLHAVIFRKALCTHIWIEPVWTRAAAYTHLPTACSWTEKRLKSERL